MKKYLTVFTVLLCLSCKNKPSESGVDSVYEKELSNISAQVKSSLKHLALDSLKIPRSLTVNDELVGVSSKDWTSGFFPGMLWYLYKHTEDTEFLRQAQNWTDFIEKEKNDSLTHDVGFKVYCSFGNGFRLTNDTLYKDVVIQASNTLISRYDPKIKCIRSWDWNKNKWQYPVIIDNMMNLEMLFEATKLTSDSIYYKVAKNHALTTMENHFRTDFSSYHVVDYDTISALPRKKITHQGYNNKSAWARGQGWALYGYTMCYRETNNKLFLNQAKHIADFILNHPNLPKDNVPYWDFNAPHIPNAMRDVSAAAVIASALLELSTFFEGNQEVRYLKEAKKILNSLALNKYRRLAPEYPFVLKQSVGSKPHGMEVGVPIIYADYYYIEALLRVKKIEKQKLNSQLQ